MLKFVLIIPAMFVLQKKSFIYKQQMDVKQFNHHPTVCIKHLIDEPKIGTMIPNQRPPSSKRKPIKASNSRGNSEKI